MGVAGVIDYGTALLHLKSGRAVRRAAWQGTCLILMPGVTLTVDALPLSAFFAEGSEVSTTPGVMQVVRAGDKHVLVPWHPTPSDQFANDWSVVNLEPEAPAPARKPATRRKTRAKRA